MLLGGLPTACCGARPGPSPESLISFLGVCSSAVRVGRQKWLRQKWLR